MKIIYFIFQPKSRISQDCTKLAGNEAAFATQPRSQGLFPSLGALGTRLGCKQPRSQGLFPQPAIRFEIIRQYLDGDWLGCLGSKTMGKQCGAWLSRRFWEGSNTSPLKTTAWEAKVDHLSRCMTFTFASAAVPQKISRKRPASIISVTGRLREHFC